MAMGTILNKGFAQAVMYTQVHLHTPFPKFVPLAKLQFTKPALIKENY